MMRIDKKTAKQVFAYGTNVPVSRTIDEIKTLLHKYAADEFFAHIQQPEEASGSYIAFVIKTRVGNVPVRVVVHRVYFNGRYLERESYRAALLTIKSKLTEVDMGEPIEHVFLANMASISRDRLLPKINVPLLEEMKP